MGRKPPLPSETGHRLILDSGAIIALSRGNQRVKHSLRLAVNEGLRVHIAAVTLAETVRGDGPRDAPVNRIINDVNSVLPVTDLVGRTAGGLLAKAGSDDTIDAIVVAIAILVGGARILTNDPDDLRALAEGEPEVVVHAV